MNLKLDKIEETDIIKSWTGAKIDESRFKLQDFVDFELDNIKKEVKKILHEEQQIEGIVGDEEKYKNTKQYYEAIEERFQKFQKKWKNLDDEVDKIHEVELKSFREDTQDIRLILDDHKEQLR